MTTPDPTVTDISLDNQKQLVVYSNRPPVSELLGGAVRVIAAAQPDIWIGPEGKTTYAQWNGDTHDNSKRYSVENNNAKPESSKAFIDVHTFAAPEDLTVSQYNVIANAILWPVMHSMDPEIFNNPMAVQRENVQEYVFTFPEAEMRAKGCDSAEEYVEKSFNDYLELNEGGNRLKESLKDDGIIKKDAVTWVHDYQCISVTGDIFSRHIPFPPMEYLEKVKIGDTPLLEMPFFEKFVDKMLEHGMITFQRPVDMQNFTEMLQHMDKDFDRNNFDLISKGKVVVPDVIGKESLISLKVRGQDVSLLNVPVGIEQSVNCEEARENEDNIRKTRMDAETLYEKTGIEMDPTHTEGVQVTLRDVISEEILNGKGHRLFASWHRNDYSKNTKEKLEAIDQFFTEHKDEVGRTHFWLSLQPTRDDVAGYKQYQDDVLKYGKKLHEKYGDSIIITPFSIDHGDVMGVLRANNVVGVIGAGKKDGHDLTVREAVDAKSDIEGAFTTIITSDGVGASDILGGSSNAKGAYVLDSSASRQEFVNGMAESIADIVTKSRFTGGLEELQQRYAYMKAQSAHYSSENYCNTILEAHAEVERQKQAAKESASFSRVG